MGGRIVLPEPDNNIQKCIKNFDLTPQEISNFWKIFQKYIYCIDIFARVKFSDCI